MLRIGAVQLMSPVVVAAMVALTDMPTRALAHEFRRPTIVDERLTLTRLRLIYEQNAW